MGYRLFDKGAGYRQCPAQLDLQGRTLYQLGQNNQLRADRALRIAFSRFTVGITGREKRYPKQFALREAA